jgi:hypothetical protein
MGNSSVWRADLKLAAASALMVAGEAVAAPVDHDPPPEPDGVPAVSGIVSGSSASATEAGRLNPDWLWEPLRDLPGAHERVIKTLSVGGPVIQRELQDMGVYEHVARTLTDMRATGALPLPQAGQTTDDWWLTQRPAVEAELKHRQEQSNTMLLSIMAGLGAMGAALYGGSLYLEHRIRKDEQAAKKPSLPSRQPTLLGRTKLTVIDGDKPDGPPQSGPAP